MQVWILGSQRALQREVAVVPFEVLVFYVSVPPRPTARCRSPATSSSRVEKSKSCHSPTGHRHRFTSNELHGGPTRSFAESGNRVDAVALFFALTSKVGAAIENG